MECSTCVSVAAVGTDSYAHLSCSSFSFLTVNRTKSAPVN